MSCLKNVNSWETEIMDTDELDRLPKSHHISKTTFLVLLGSIIFYFIDIIADFYLLVWYYERKQLLNFWLTLIFVCVPSVIITSISIVMYVKDVYESNENLKGYAFLRIFLCLLGFPVQLAILVRYCDSMRYAWQCYKAESASNKNEQEKLYKKMVFENSDVSLLKVFECFTETASQQILQITLLLIDTRLGPVGDIVVRALFIAFGFIGIGITMAAYHRSIRLEHEHKNNISKTGFFVQFLWQSNFIVSRILSISVIAAVYPLYTCLAVFLHWCGMLIWVATTKKINFCGKNYFSHICFSALVGLVYIFNYFNLKDGSTRNSYLIFYFLCGIENTVAVVIWGLKGYDYFKVSYYICLIVPVLTFFFSVISAVVYYKYLHPNVKTKKAVYDEDCNDEK